VANSASWGAWVVKLCIFAEIQSFFLSLHLRESIISIRVFYEDAELFKCGVESTDQQPPSVGIWVLAR
jgi:hypothetical protein